MYSIMPFLHILYVKNKKAYNLNLFISLDLDKVQLKYYHGMVH